MNKKTGNYGEALSKKYLIDKGYFIIATNYRTKVGEIDIIAQKDDIVVFIEVKTRKNSTFGLPRESVNFKKQSTIYIIAQQYIQQKKLKNMSFRFDVIEVLLMRDQIQINHIENAF
ncbi:putative endonuclease [Natronincola peptidivorans]|uniref:UPF0102 protein SAMN05660297_00177 n=1 Tax=Natronincola peptidivorans TaxID=426128 RepID=A0A1H9YDP7_9FIRM|nr:YraN family protein [Natronincola peptidivorans]SES67074.1 putative endonuclease [Natronincola peptidivorans]